MRPHLRLALLAAAIAGAALVVATTVARSPSGVRDLVDGLGVFGPIVFCLVTPWLSAAFFPGPLIAASSGLLFGTALGTVVSITGGTLSALLAFSISRRAGRPAFEAMELPRVRRLQDAIERRGFVAVLYARLIPGLPFTVVNYSAGLTRLSLGVFAAATAIGIAPRAFAYTALGGNLDDLGRPEAIVAMVLIGLSLLGGATLLVRDRRRATSAPPRSAPGTGSSCPGGRSADLP